MDYFQYYFQHAYLVKRCQSEACFVCNALLSNYTYEQLSHARASAAARDAQRAVDDPCYALVGLSRMQVEWRRCWEILGALQRQLPAVINAREHELAVAWHARGDAGADAMVALPDVHDQAGFVVCRRLGCC